MGLSSEGGGTHSCTCKDGQRAHLDISWKALGSQTGAQKMRQDLQLDSCAYWLVFEVLLDIASLMHTQNSIIY